MASPCADAAKPDAGLGGPLTALHEELSLLQFVFGPKLNCGQPVVQCPFTTTAIAVTDLDRPRQGIANAHVELAREN
ncbi:MAG: hypothetical protein ACRED3_06990 [Bradyrhizobium sp.]